MLPLQVVRDIIVEELTTYQIDVNDSMAFSLDSNNNIQLLSNRSDYIKRNFPTFEKTCTQKLNTEVDKLRKAQEYYSSLDLYYIEPEQYVTFTLTQIYSLNEV